jgi:hypothetical protein
VAARAALIMEVTVQLATPVEAIVEEAEVTMGVATPAEAIVEEAELTMGMAKAHQTESHQTSGNAHSVLGTHCPSSRDPVGHTSCRLPC